MSHITHVEPKGRYLHITISGDNSVEDVKGYLAEVGEACRRHGCTRVLLEEDLRGPRLGAFDIYEIVSEMIGQMPRGAGAFAYVDVSPDHDPREVEFAETVAYNQGAPVRLFATVAEAEQWLRGKPGDAPGAAPAAPVSRTP